MRHALIIAGGSGTRLWPMSRRRMPKQLIPFLGGRSLLQIAMARVEWLAGPECRYVCALDSHRAGALMALPDLLPDNYLGEPAGRDTLNAVGLAAAVISRRDPEAVIGTFTADQVIEPLSAFRAAVEAGFRAAETLPGALVTFGIRPTGPATGYGYLELGGVAIDEARDVRQFREKPSLSTARDYVEAGPGRYLWNSGMFVWRAETILDAIGQFEPDAMYVLDRVADLWDTPRRGEALRDAYAKLRKISVDFAVMEPASQHHRFRVVAVPMDLQWMDVGSWPTYAGAMQQDEAGNTVSAERHILEGTRNCVVVSDDPRHLMSVVGCEDLVVVHTADVTLICHRDHAERVKEIHRRAEARFGDEHV